MVNFPLSFLEEKKNKVTLKCNGVSSAVIHSVGLNIKAFSENKIWNIMTSLNPRSIIQMANVLLPHDKLVLKSASPLVSIFDTSPRFWCWSWHEWQQYSANASSVYCVSFKIYSGYSGKDISFNLAHNLGFQLLIQFF